MKDKLKRCPNGCKYKSGDTCVASECPYQTGDVKKVMEETK